MKKIAFIISDQHLIPHGGIGSFCKSFSEMISEAGHELHIITEKKPTNKFAYTLLDLVNVQLKWNDKPMSYSQHQSIFMYKEGVNFEKIINFQQIILEVLENHQYDYIVVNTQEAFAAIATINTGTKVILYTHLYKQIYPEATIKDVFLPSYHTYFDTFLHADYMTVGTQSEHNKNKLVARGITNVEVLPMPMSERGLLTENLGDRSGVLYIGRWETGKNPEAYIQVMKECKLPCKVLTNSSGEKKFIEAFKKAGITDYEIVAGVTGKTKNNFIKNCKVSFNCSLVENYSFAFIECVGHMPVVALDVQSWTDNFDSKFYVKTSLKDAAKAVSEAYNIEPSDWYKMGSLEYVKKLDYNAKQRWTTL